ncbi:MAG: hypothetical protein ACYSR3_15115 [Planctomycetota bacterium]|jgi:hypothetical protein
MKARYCATNIESDDSAMLQYESLRSQVLREQGSLPEQNLGLALFVRQGMLAWIKICHQCIPANPSLDKKTQAIDAPYETKSEMIKVMANITLFNLKETQT